MDDDVAYAVPPMLPAQLVKSVEFICSSGCESSYSCDRSVIKVELDLEADGAPIFPTTTRLGMRFDDSNLRQNWKKTVDEVEALGRWGRLVGVREYIQKLEREGDELFVEVILKVLETLLTSIHQLNIYKTLTEQEGNPEWGEWDEGKFEYCEYVDGEYMFPVLRCVFVHGLDVADVVCSMLNEMERSPHAFGGRTTWWSTVRALSSVQFV